jgi:hypothetical protein
MKEQITQTRFTCDECGAKSGLESKFPYIKGWAYLYNFSFKLGENLVPMPKDKHFCSKECLTKFVNKLLERSLTCLFG